MLLFVGELGWELYVPVDMARHAYDHLMKIGKEFNIIHAGFHALDSCRIEKKFIYIGHDAANEDTPLECGLGYVNSEPDITNKFIEERNFQINIGGDLIDPRASLFALYDPKGTRIRV